MHAEAWTLTSEYRDRSEWNQFFLKECTILDSYSIPLNLNQSLIDSSSAQPSYQQHKKLHFEDYLIKVSDDIKQPKKASFIQNVLIII